MPLCAHVRDGNVSIILENSNKHRSENNVHYSENRKSFADFEKAED